MDTIVAQVQRRANGSSRAKKRFVCRCTDRERRREHSIPSLLCEASRVTRKFLVQVQLNYVVRALPLVHIHPQIFQESPDYKSFNDQFLLYHYLLNQWTFLHKLSLKFDHQVEHVTSDIVFSNLFFSFPLVSSWRAQGDFSTRSRLK